MQSKLIQYLIYVLICIASIEVSCWAVKVTPTPTTGILLPAKTVLAASDPNKIEIFGGTDLSIPLYTELGTVHVETHFDKIAADTEDKTVRYAKELAASVGANAIILRVLAPEASDSEPAGLRKYMLIGKAVHIP